MLIIYLCFELAYGVRFVYDVFISSRRYSFFVTHMIADLMVLTEGLSFLALLIFHNKNFKLEKKQV